MKLHLLRHAKTLPTSDTGKDIDRALSVKGISQSNLMGDYFKSVHGIEGVWCSSAMRTRQTLDIVRYHKPLEQPHVLDDLYLCSRDQFLEMIWNHEGNKDLLIVGHNFGISDLATYFTNSRLEMRTSEYFCIEFECSNWKETSRGTGTIVDQFRPRVFVP